MERFRYNNLRSYLSVCVLLSLLFSLFYGQGVKLHAHILDHEHAEHLPPEHQNAKNNSEGEYLSTFHSVHDLSHSEYHNEIIYELGDSSGKTLKTTSSNPSVFELFVFSFLFLVIYPPKRAILFFRENKSDFHFRYLLIPPLRAPPR